LSSNHPAPPRQRGLSLLTILSHFPSTSIGYFFIIFLALGDNSKTESNKHIDKFKGWDKKGGKRFEMKRGCL
jgi:hypothetical protein